MPYDMIEILGKDMLAWELHYKITHMRRVWIFHVIIEFLRRKCFTKPVSMGVKEGLKYWKDEIEEAWTSDNMVLVRTMAGFKSFRLENA